MFFLFQTLYIYHYTNLLVDQHLKLETVLGLVKPTWRSMDPPHAVDRNTNIGENNQEHCCVGKLDESSELRGMKPGPRTLTYTVPERLYVERKF